MAQGFNTVEQQYLDKINQRNPKLKPPLKPGDLLFIGATPSGREGFETRYQLEITSQNLFYEGQFTVWVNRLDLGRLFDGLPISVPVTGAQVSTQHIARALGEMLYYPLQSTDVIPQAVDADATDVLITAAPDSPRFRGVATVKIHRM